MFAMCYDCAKMSVYVGRYLFRDEVCFCRKHGYVPVLLVLLCI